MEDEPRPKKQTFRRSAMSPQRLSSSSGATAVLLLPFRRPEVATTHFVFESPVVVDPPVPRHLLASTKSIFLSPISGSLSSG